MISNTRDTAELNHFRNFSSDWWDEAGPYRILHTITPLRMAFIREKVEIHFRMLETSTKPFKGLRILDVGCGGGILCEPLARLGADVTGIDPLEENIDVAKTHAKEMGLSITYLPYAIEDLESTVDLFDVVVASEIIEHVANPNQFLKACVKHLAPCGGMVVTTLNKTLRSYLLGILAAEYVLKWAPRGTHSWDKFMAPEILSHKLAALGLGEQDIRGLSFSPLTGEWSLSSCAEINYFLWAGKYL
ncbi:MAG: bifunctional 2-polyprenyl-6-hydroxyphenol methylase/3-demethylubiquinol 3-O-methyltransferase UbiG [Proteobacteria bacterium]|nr:bifunctional 2-polyprenyl-6-hydroxyphenol methylase/3-demethylubiquinol 3-O-methyltransferase UbiG [Pseudomonadota bacterium]